MRAFSRSSRAAWSGSPARSSARSAFPLSATTCDYLAWAEAAEAAVGGEVLAEYTNLIVVFPKTDACSWAGLAYLGGSTAWINGEPTLTAFAHELGHNLGLGHASSLICTASDQRVTLSETCTIGGDYGDPFTTMGSGTSAHLTAVHKAQLGWLAPGTVQTVTTAGTFTLAPLAAPGHGLRALRIPWGDEHLYVEFRQPYGLFERFWPGSALGRVMIRLADESAPEWRSRLLDATPATPAYLDATLVLGQVLIDPVVGVRIATISVTRDTATVAIEFGTPGALPIEAPADRERPTAPRVRGASVFITAGRARVRLRWHRSRDASGIRHYVVLRNGRPIARTNRPVLIDRPRLGRRHVYRVVAIDRAGNRSACSRRLAVPLPRHLGRPRQATGRGVVRAHVGTNGRVVVNGRAAVRAGWTVRYVLR